MIDQIKKIIISVSISICLNIYPQDIPFAQMQLNKSNLNPAYCSTIKQPEIFAHYRNQIPTLANGFRTYNIYYTQAFQKTNNGISIGITSDQLAGGIYTTQIFDFNYSHKSKIGHFSNISYGIQASLLMNTNNTSGVDFATPENVSSQTIYEPKFSFGCLYSKKDWTFGVTVNDLSSLISYNKNNLSSLRIITEIEKKINLYQIENTSWEKGSILTPSFIARYYMSHISYTYGLTHEKHHILSGIWIRNGFPFYFTNFIFGLGYRIKDISVFYTYDVNAQILTIPSPMTNSHEISIQISLWQNQNKPNKEALKCPKINEKNHRND